MPARPNAEELEEFLTRAVAQVVVRNEFAAHLRSGERPLRVKQGFDPTTKNLHIGHAVGLRKLKKLAEWGHEIILIVGDWTTQIGDPTDKDLTRPTRSRDEVMENAQTYLDQFHLIVPRAGTRTVLQDEWFGKFGLRDVIDLTSRFTVQQMLAREEFRKRQTAGTPIPIKDLLYPLLQAYDSIAIRAEVEFGGTDQLFNILAGRELQEMLGQPPQQMMLVHLLEGLDGEKMSKSKPATAIWLTDPPDEMFGKVMAIADAIMPHYFEWATEMPMAEVRETLDALARRELHPREAKERLARRIVTEVHSAAAADEAAAAFRRQFTERKAPDEVPETALERNGEGSVPIVELLVRTAMAASKSEARRLVKQRGVKVDSVVADEGTAVPTTGSPLIQVGPRGFRRVRWV
ncbi:MAG: tyrosine--tRNA ligase [Candidatus Limnocylindria bacterium]